MLKIKEIFFFSSIKLVALLGGLEVFGAIRSSDAEINAYLRLVYTFMRSSRGIAIFIGQVLVNKEVRAIYKGTASRIISSVYYPSR